MNKTSALTPNTLATPTLMALAPWLLLLGRTVLFIVMQALFALGFLLAGSASAWERSANWWPVGVMLVNLICLALLAPLFRAEGQRYWDIFRIERQHLPGDLLVMLRLTALTAPVSYLPNVWLGQWLFGNAAVTLDLIVRPLPLWAVYIGVIVLFPVTQGLVELALYFAYAMPRLERQGLNKWGAVSLAALMLGLQHLAIPLLPDWRFITWRALMFIPFAFLAGLALRWRPRLLPYIAVVHALMDMAFATMFLSVAY